MSLSHSHQVHAARCRHATAQAAKARFWADLDARLEVFLLSPGASLARFCARERGRLLRAHGELGFRLSTACTWLRDWGRERKTVSQTDHKEAA